MVNLVKLVWSDLQAMVWKSYSPRSWRFWAFLSRQLLMHQGFWAVIHYRYGHWAFYTARIPIWRQFHQFTYLFSLPLVRVWSGTDISYKARIGPGITLVHSLQVIGEIRAGKNLVLHAGVLAGQAKNVYPTLGDDVVLGARCIVIGDVRVGHRVKIGAGAVVVKDLPDDTTAVGNPARTIR